MGYTERFCRLNQGLWLTTAVTILRRWWIWHFWTTRYTVERWWISLISSQ